MIRIPIWDHDHKPYTDIYIPCFDHGTHEIVVVQCRNKKPHSAKFQTAKGPQAQGSNCRSWREFRQKQTHFLSWSWAYTIRRAYGNKPRFTDFFSNFHGISTWNFHNRVPGRQVRSGLDFWIHSTLIDPSCLAEPCCTAQCHTISQLLKRWHVALSCLPLFKAMPFSSCVSSSTTNIVSWRNLRQHTSVLTRFCR